MNFLDKAHIASKFVIPDAAEEKIRYVYAHDGKIFATNGFAAFVSIDEGVTNFKGIMHPLPSKKKDELEFDPCLTPEQEHCLDEVENMIITHLTKALSFEDAQILNIEDYESEEVFIYLDPDIVKAEKEAKKKKKKESEEDGVEKRERKLKTERKVTRNYSKFILKTLDTESSLFHLILNKDFMFEIIKIFKGMPTLKASTHYVEPVCIKRNDQCGLTDDIYFLIMPYKGYK